MLRKGPAASVFLGGNGMSHSSTVQLLTDADEWI